MKKNIALITNAENNSGVGSRAFQLMLHMGEQEDLTVIPVLLDGRNNNLEVDHATIKHLSSLPGVLGSKSISWIRLARYIPTFDIYDLTNQTLSFISKKRRPSIVTVHDIIELTDPQDPKARLLNRYLMSGITHATNVVAVSNYTKNRIQEYFGISDNSITVIPNGVDDTFEKIPNFISSIAYQELVRDFGLAGRNPVILSVGSEHPRKNMITILHTIALLKKQFPDVLLVKVGEAGLLSGRKETLDTIDELHLKSNVKLIGSIPTDRLNELYNIADALLFPSHNEGFGMPPLEAMAAGCPVVCSNATSLPEVVGNGALMHSPDNAEAFAKSIQHLVINKEFRSTLVQKGKAQAARYTWSNAAAKTLALYRN